MTARRSRISHKPWAILSIGTVLIGAFSLSHTGPVLNIGGLPQALQFLRASLHPDLSFDFLQIIIRATGVTFAYAVCGTLLSIAIGFLGGILSSEIWWHAVWPNQAGRSVVRGLLAIPRAIHELIWGLVLVNLLGLDPLVAILAITIPFSAIVAKVFSEILDETPRAPMQLLVSAGVAPPSAVLYGLLPQALPNLLSYSFYRFECALRSSAVLGIIGAGGLGYEIFLSLQSLRYEQLWTAFYALILLNGCVDAWSAAVRQRLGFVSRLALGLPQRKEPQDLGGRQSNWWIWSGIGLMGLLCFWFVGADWSLLWSGRTVRLLSELAASAIPQVPTLAQGITLLQVSWQTVVMSLLASILASMGGLVLSLPAARGFLLPKGLLGTMASETPWAVAVGKFGYVGTRLFLLVSRAVPAPIWALVFLFILFPGIWPGALALALHNLGILGRLMAEVNENTEQRSIRALRIQGASALQTLLYGLLPVTLPQFLAYSLYRWEVCLRATVIVGLVGAGGLGRLMMEQISSFDYGGLTLTLTIFVFLTIVVDSISAALRQKLR